VLRVLNGRQGSRLKSGGRGTSLAHYFHKKGFRHDYRLITIEGIMLTFKKGDLVKYINPESDLIPVLKKDGWVEQKKKPVKSKDGDGK